MNRPLPLIERHGCKSLLRRAPRHIVYQDIDMIKFIEASLHELLDAILAGGNVNPGDDFDSQRGGFLLRRTERIGVIQRTENQVGSLMRKCQSRASAQRVTNFRHQNVFAFEISFHGCEKNQILTIVWAICWSLKKTVRENKLLHSPRNSGR